MNEYYFQVVFGDKQWFVSGIGKSESGVKKRLFGCVLSSVPKRDLYRFEVLNSTKEDYDKGLNYDKTNDLEESEVIEELQGDVFMFPIFD